MAHLTKTLITTIAATAFLVFAPLAAEAQQELKVRKIGFISVYSKSRPGSDRWHEAFRRGLRKSGWIAGENIDIVYRWLAGRRDHIPALVDEMLDLKVELIVVHGGALARGIQRKSRTIPVVMAEASDALGRGIIQSLARPGGNITGLSSITPVLAAKRLELLKVIVPNLTRVAVLWTPKSPASRYGWKKIQDPAQKLGLTLHSTELRDAADLGKAFKQAAKAGAGAFITTSGVGATFGIKEITDFATKSRLPAIYTDAAHVMAGGLISYNRTNVDLYYRAAAYVDKILKGAKPSDLPVEQPTKFDLVVNLKAAKVLGITIPRSVLLRATKVIE